MGPVNITELMRQLFGIAVDPRPVVDRMSMLPIGQHEDGSLTPAVPGMLKDAWVANARGLSGQGTPMDALTVASLAPMAGIGAAAARDAGASMAGATGGIRDAVARKQFRVIDGSDVQSSLKNAMIAKFPDLPQRPFDADYTNILGTTGAPLTHTIDGQPVTAKFVAGRRVAGGLDEGLATSSHEGAPWQSELAARELADRIDDVASRAIGGNAGRYISSRGPSGPERSILLNRELTPAKRLLVLDHEQGHMVDDLAGDIPIDGLSAELRGVYHAGTVGDGLTGALVRPEHSGYRGPAVDREKVAEAIRAYIENPNYIKTVAPRTAARIREYVNANPRIRQILQFNANPDEAAAVPLALNAAQEPQGIRAYHGSPHDFDRFDASHIGSGEGAQAYGHGLYFAENEGVAKSYRDRLAQGKQTIPSMSKDARKYLNEILDDYKSNIYREGPLQDETELKSVLMDAYNPWDDVPRNAVINELTDLINNGKLKLEPDPGRTYEVSINAKPEDFLDWDKPLRDQSKKVGDVFRVMGIEEGKSPQHPLTNKRRPTGSLAGEQLLDEIAESLRLGYGAIDRSAIARVLHNSGIPGIRYLDQGSRAAGEGSHNYVVFPGNEHLIDIIKKYGIATAAAIFGADAVINATTAKAQSGDRK